MLMGAGTAYGQAPKPNLAGHLADRVTGKRAPRPSVPKQQGGRAPGRQDQVPAAVTRAVARAQGHLPSQGAGQIPAATVPAAKVGQHVTGPADPGGADSYHPATSKLVPSGSTATSKLYRNADGSYTRLDSPAHVPGSGPRTLTFSGPAAGVGVTGTRVTSASLRVPEAWTGKCPATATVNVTDASGQRVGHRAGRPPATACGTGAKGGNVSVPIGAAGLKVLGSRPAITLTVTATSHSSQGAAQTPAAAPRRGHRPAAGAAAPSASPVAGPLLVVSAAVDAPPQVDDQWPTNGYHSPTLTPELIASGSDPDGDPVGFNFTVLNADGTTAAASDWIGTNNWVVPAGALAWNRTYYWTVLAGDGVLASSDPPIFVLKTPVPQPPVDSNFDQDGTGPGSSSQPSGGPDSMSQASSGPGSTSQDGSGSGFGSRPSGPDLASPASSGPGFDPQNGNFTTQATDVDVPVTGPPLSLQRTYNSLDPLTSGAFGTGWTSVLDMTIRPGPPGVDGSAATEIVTYPDGQQVTFGKNADGTTYTPLQGRYGTLLTMTGGWELVDKTDVIYEFTRSLGSGVFAITELNDPMGHALHLTYNASGQVTLMNSAASDRSLHLTWSTPDGAQQPHIATVSTDPVTPGNQATAITWQYTYSGDQLTAACNESQDGQPCTAYTYQTGSDFPAAVLNSGPQSYWRLNDDSGTTAASSVLANEGTDNATYVGVQHLEPGPAEGEPASVKAADFDGSDSLVRVPASLGDEAAAMTVSLAFKAAAPGGVLFSESADPLSDGTTMNPYQPVVYIGSDGDLQGGFPGTGAPISSGFPVNDENWHLVTLTSNGSREVMYLDGDQVAAKAAQASAFPQPHIYLGAGFLGGTDPDEPHAGQTPTATYFSGAMSDVATWARPLTAAEVSALFQTGISDAALLTTITRPSLRTFEHASYDPVTSQVRHVTDGNGGSWTVNAPSVTGSSRVYATAVQGAEPQDYWRLADTGTTTAVNQLAGGAATYNDVTQGVPNGPFSDQTVDGFDGSSSYLALPDDLIGPGNQSVSLWFKTTATDGILLSSSADSIDNTTTQDIFSTNLYIGDDGQLLGEFDDGDGAMSSGVPVNDGTWHNVVLAAGTASQAMYLDGRQVDAKTGTIAGGTAWGEGNVYVGVGFFGQDWPDQPHFSPTDSTGFRAFFNGDIAEVAVYPRKEPATAVTDEWAAAQHSPGLTPVQTTTVTDPGSHRLVFRYDPDNSERLLSRTDGLGNTTSYGYDKNGFQDRIVDPDGHVTDLGFDVRGNMVSKTTCQDQAARKCSESFYSFTPNDDDATLSAPFSANDLVKTSSDGRSSSKDDTTYRTTNVYNPTGELLTTTTPPVPGFPSGRTTHYAYTDGTTTAGSADGSIPPGGLLYKTTSPGGAVTRTLYDAAGDIGKTINADGLTTTYTYDGISRKTSQTVIVPDAGLPNPHLVTTYSYDANGRVTRQTNPATTDRVTGDVHTARITTTYDADGDVLSQMTADTTGGDAPRTVSYTYTAHDQKASSTDAAGAVTHYTYDAYGNRASQTDPAGNETDYTYDPNGHLLTTTLLAYTGSPPGSQAPAPLIEESRAYDPAGRLASVTDAMGRVTSYGYTDDGLTASVTRTGPGDGSAVQEQDTYDAAGNLTVKVTNNGATTTNYAVDAADQITSQTVDPNGLDRVTANTYDPDDHVIKKDISQGDGSPIQSTSYTYDPMGNKTSQTVDDPGAGGPAGWWTLTQTSGTTVADTSGTGNQATATGVTWDGDGVGLPGQGGQKITTRGPVVDTTGSFTVTAWANMAAKTGDETVVSQDAQSVAGFYLGYDSGGDAWGFERPEEDENDPPDFGFADASAPAQTGTWVFLAGVYDANTGDFTLYVNGSQAAQNFDPNAIAANGPVEIGSDKWDGQTGQDNFDGEITNVEAYTAALSPSEISNLFGQTRGGGDITWDGQTTSWTLDQRGLPTTQTDPDRNTTLLSYDEAGHEVSATGPGASIQTGQATPFIARETTTTGYDTFGDLTEKEDPNGDTTTYAFDADSRQVSQTLAPYTPPGASTPVNGTSTEQYNSLGQVTSKTDADGNTTTFSYDQLGDQTGQTDPNGGVTTTSYDADREQLSQTGPTGARSTATYDFLGRQITATDVERLPSPAAFTTVTSYTPTTADPSGTWKSSVTSPEHVVTTYGYDALGETTSVTDGAGNTTSHAFDALGRQVSTHNPDGTSQTVTYDPVGNPVAKRNLSASGQTLSVTSTTYDAAGHKLSTTDALGNTTAYTYNPYGKDTAETQPVTNAIGIITSFGYDGAGNQTRYTDGRGNDLFTTYTSRNLPQDKIAPATAQHSSPADSTTRTTYDGNGNPVSVTEPGGVSLSYSYDTMGNLTGQSGSGANAATADRSFTYDNAGNMLTANTSNTATSASNATSERFTYDDRGLPLSSAGSAGPTTYGYNGDGQPASVQDTAGTTTYGYDSDGRLRTMHDPASGTNLTYAYDQMSQVSQISYGTGADTQAFGYDNLHRLTSDTLSTTGGTTVASIGYGYNADGNLTSKATSQFTGSGSNSYGYDQAGRLVSWNNGATTTTYTYDASGNGTKAGNVTYTYDARDELTFDGTSSYTYTANGDLSSVSGPSGTVTSTSDAYGQQATQGSQSDVYDATGRDVQVAVTGGATTALSYQGTTGQLTSDGSTTYTWTPDGTLTGAAAVGSSGAGRLNLTDQHTDVIGQFTASGTALTGWQTFDPWGDVTATGGGLGSLGYQSQYTSPTTGQTDMGARWYNPTTGRFGNKDTTSNNPVPNSASASPFGYAADDPLDKTDPSGHHLVPVAGGSSGTTVTITNPAPTKQVAVPGIYVKQEKRIVPVDIPLLSPAAAVQAPYIRQEKRTAPIDSLMLSDLPSFVQAFLSGASGGATPNLLPSSAKLSSAERIITSALLALYPLHLQMPTGLPRADYVIFEVGKDNPSIQRLLKELWAKAHAKFQGKLPSFRPVPVPFPAPGLALGTSWAAAFTNAVTARSGAVALENTPPEKDVLGASGTSLSVVLTRGGHVFLGTGSYTGASGTTVSLRSGKLNKVDPTEDDIDKFVAGLTITYEGNLGHVDVAAVTSPGTPGAATEVGVTTDSGSGVSVSISASVQVH
ncbi:MAG TPA: LamG-like jellyroll fold domain-containing protein [Mycobacteriales bacterium]|nr:LamG-like jellyroll fold domain-containing protein [Mycobacteriales bacterium]